MTFRSAQRVLTTPMRAAVLVVLALTVSIGVGACGTNNPGVAASVDGRDITIDQLHETSSALTQLAGQPIDEKQVLTVMIVGPYLVHAAQESQVGVDAEQVRQAIATELENPSDEVVQWYRAVASSQQLGMLSPDQQMQVSQELEKTIQAADITVNPRYGTFDKTNVDIAPAPMNWTLDVPTTQQPLSPQEQLQQQLQQGDPGAPGEQPAPDQMQPDQPAPHQGQPPAEGQMPQDPNSGGQQPAQGPPSQR